MQGTAACFLRCDAAGSLRLRSVVTLESLAQVLTGGVCLHVSEAVAPTYLLWRTLWRDIPLYCTDRSQDPRTFRRVQH